MRKLAESNMVMFWIAVFSLFISIGYNVYSYIEKLNAEESYQEDKAEWRNKTDSLSEQNAESLSETADLKEEVAALKEIAKRMGVPEEVIATASQKGVEDFFENEEEAAITFVELRAQKAMQREFDKHMDLGRTALNQQQYSNALGHFFMAAFIDETAPEPQKYITEWNTKTGLSAQLTNGGLDLDKQHPGARTQEVGGILFSLAKSWRSGDEITCYFDIMNQRKSDVNFHFADGTFIVDPEGEITSELDHIWESNKQEHPQKRILLPCNVKKRVIARFIMPLNHPIEGLRTLNVKCYCAGDKMTFSYPGVILDGRKDSHNNKEHSNTSLTLLGTKRNGNELLFNFIAKNMDSSRTVHITNLAKSTFENTEGFIFEPTSQIVHGEREHPGARIILSPGQSRKFTMVFKEHQNKGVFFGSPKELLLRTHMFGAHHKYQFALN
ncbi:hypothetical protein [Pseudodesulfovibrio sp. zrk46]|uniref:hypothetical protein n=1 Tax=Pseudodesulfovibrio sp. zrk46 TaxID=2725288 RepID=UPI00144926A9|nr:hypothetical protein [Pseudodesulfovibrio sp. zrk46]QJB55375.1 hypothetical protein HFN16_02745 [Pseudodesulfovibrio sp. zrk46]